ncbi:MAG: SMC-Scp complex subunit ScpB [Steroidobacteraceae bacterium]
MSDNYIRNVIEASLLSAGRPLTLADLAELFEEALRPDKAALLGAIEALRADYAGRSIEVREVASGYRIQVRSEFAPEVGRLFPERPQRYSRALLETLALIAYRQPITRAEIEQVRGVAVNPNIIKTLMERNWVRVVGHRDVPGHPELLGTTRDFLDYFGLKSLDDLPPLAELRDMADLNPQLPLPGTQLDNADASGVFTAEAPPDAVADGDEDAPEDGASAAAGDDDGDTTPRHAAGDTTADLVAAPRDQD